MARIRNPCVPLFSVANVHLDGRNFYSIAIFDISYLAPDSIGLEKILNKTNLGWPQKPKIYPFKIQKNHGGLKMLIQKSIICTMQYSSTSIHTVQ